MLSTMTENLEGRCLTQWTVLRSAIVSKMITVETLVGQEDAATSEFAVAEPMLGSGGSRRRSRRHLECV